MDIIVIVIVITTIIFVNAVVIAFGRVTDGKEQRINYLGTVCRWSNFVNERFLTMRPLIFHQ